MTSPPRDPWKVDALTISRALGYVVGLPSFILGTATFMLGFALERATILDTACLLYGLSLTGIGWRIAAGRVEPTGIKPALALLLAVLATAAGWYWLLRYLLWVIGAPANG